MAMKTKTGERKTRVTPQEARDAVAAGRSTLVDVRRYDDYLNGHADGAVCIPLAELERRAGELPRDTPVDLVCRLGNSSGIALQKLQALGFENAANVAGGMEAWKAAGLPVVKRVRPPMSVERQTRLVVGTLVLLGILGSRAAPALLYVSAFMGCGLVFAGLTDWCGLSMLVAKAPWNRDLAERGGADGGACRL